MSDILASVRQLLSLTGWEVTFSPAQPTLVGPMLQVLLETSPVEVLCDEKRGTVTIRRKNDEARDRAEVTYDM